MKTNNQQCSCQVWTRAQPRKTDGFVGIDFCPLHTAARDILAALEWAAKCVETGAWLNEDYQTPDIERIHAAIAKAKGE